MHPELSHLSASERKALLVSFGRALASFDPLTRDRGLAYAREGRVIRLTVTATGVEALVRGQLDYTTSAERHREGISYACECPAFERERRCKHLAAALFAAGASGPGRESYDPQASKLPKLVERYPNLPLRSLASRLALYTGQRIPVPADGWRSIADYVKTLPPEAPSVIARAIEAHETEILETLETLSSFRPPELEPSRLPGFRRAYQSVAALFGKIVSNVTVTEHLPGPLDARHPGFSFVYRASQRKLVVREVASSTLDTPLSYELTFPVDPDAELLVARPVSLFSMRASYWEAFVLREILTALAERRVPALAELEADLGKPVWEQLLDGVAPPEAEPDIDTREEIAFSLTPFAATYLDVRAHGRSLTKTGKPKWRRVPIETLADGSSPAPPTVRKLARVLSGTPGRDKGMARIDVASASGHELLAIFSGVEVLAWEPRAGDTNAPDPMDLAVGDLSMVLALDDQGTARPVFRIGAREAAHEVTREVLQRGQLSGTGFWGYVKDARVYSAAVPKALRPWLESYLRDGAALTFPPEAMEKVTARLAPLVASGAAEVPKAAMGAETTAKVRAALRIEWRPEGSAALELLVSVHPDAPLVEPGVGPQVYTFRDAEGNRLYVDRDFAEETRVLSAACQALPSFVTWQSRFGFTSDVHDTLALAKLLAENSPVARVETKTGVAPTVFDWESTDRTLTVSKQGAYFAVRGDVRLEGKGLTLGELLDAMRLARRYVRLGEGRYVELPEDVEKTLVELATAADLAASARARDEDGTLQTRVHDAFTTMLAEAESLFHRASGFDVRAHEKALRAARKKPKAAPRIERGELRPYQVEGVEWMLGLAAWAPGCILADDMGLGKTVQTAALLWARRKLGPQLVVAPASVSSNWVVELERFVPSLRVLWLNEQRHLDPSKLGPGDVLVVSYGLLARVAPTFEKTELTTLVIDEAQFLKNALTQRSSLVRALSRTFTVALTGTPLENHLGDLWSIVDQVFPGLLGTEDTFRERFRKPIETGPGDGRKLFALSRLVAPFLLRRTRKEVLRELPPREEITRFVTLSAGEAEKYAALRKACEVTFGKRKKGETVAQARIVLLAALTRLRQLACDASLVDPEWTEPSSKLDMLVEITSELAQAKSRVLVFSQFTQLLDRALVRLRAAGLRVAYLAGDTPTTSRRDVVDAFQRGEFDVFCVSLMAGGTGLNLTHANYVIHLDPWWNPAAEEQATSRAHRMGQTEPVTVFRLVSKGTIEEAILDLHAKKRDLASAVLEGKAAASSLTPEDLLALVRFGEA